MLLLPPAGSRRHVDLAGALRFGLRAGSTACCRPMNLRELRRALTAATDAANAAGALMKTNLRRTKKVNEILQNVRKLQMPQKYKEALQVLEGALELEPNNWKQLLKNLKSLDSAEILALQDALTAGVFSGKIASAVYLERVAKIIESGSSDAIVASLASSRFVFDYLIPRTEKSAKRAAALYARPVKLLGLDANTEQDKTAPAATADQRLRVLEFVAQTGRDKQIRKALTGRGSAFLGLDGKVAQPHAVKPDLLEVALAVTLQERGEPAVTALKAQLLGSSDAIFRGQALRALGWVDDATQAAALRDFSLAPSLRGNEVLLILSTQANQVGTSDALWLWLQNNFAKVLARLGEKTHAQVLELAATRCDAAGEKSVEEFFTPKINFIINGPRGLAIILEKIARCRALRERV